jgi:hypothetical protein
MSVSCVIIPVVVTSWPSLLPVLLGAAGALGFKPKAQAGTEVDRARARASGGAVVEVENAAVLSDEVGAGNSLTVERDGVTLRFAVDGRGRCRVHVDGPGRTKAELEEIGRQAGRKVVQMYSYHRVMAQAEELGYQLTTESVDEQGAIRIRLKRG